MPEEKFERKPIIAEMFDSLNPDADTDAMLERANAILTEAGQRSEYDGSIATAYASEAFELLNHPNYEQKENAPLGIRNVKVWNNVTSGVTLRQYCQYLLERSRENYVNEASGDHPKIATAARDFIDKK